MKYYTKILFIVLLAVGIISESTVYAQNQSKTAAKNLTTQLNNNIAQTATGTQIASQIMRSKKTTDYSVKVNGDSLNTTSRISRIWNSNERYSVEIVLEDKNASFELVAYNMFGKKVVDIVETGDINSNIRVYSFNATSLPNGVYLCVHQGRNVRDVEKFIVSR